MVKITVDNWKHVGRAIREIGVQDTIYDSDRVIQTIILKSGERYELTDVTPATCNLIIVRTHETIM